MRHRSLFQSYSSSLCVLVQFHQVTDFISGDQLSVAGLEVVFARGDLHPALPREGGVSPRGGRVPR